MTPFTWTDDYSRTDPSTHVARNGASGLVYQEKCLKTRHMLAMLVLGEELPGGFFAGLTTDAGEKAELFAILAVVIHMGV